MENRYVTGLQGSVSKRVNNTFKGQKIQLDTGDLFRICWDFDRGNPPDPTKNIDQETAKAYTSTRSSLAKGNHQGSFHAEHGCHCQQTR